jgi:MFS family permease
MSLATLVTGPFNGRLVQRLGPRRPLIAGLLLMSASFGVLFMFRTSLTAIMLTMALFGFALSLTMIASINLILIATPPTHLGVSTAMNQTFRITGGSLGPAVAAFYFSAHTTRVGTAVIPSSTAYALAFASAAVMVGLGAAVAVFLRDRRPGQEATLSVGGHVEETPVGV